MKILSLLLMVFILPLQSFGKSVKAFPSTRKEVRFIKRMNDKIDKVHARANKYLEKYDESGLLYNADKIIKNINYEQKFAINITKIDQFQSMTDLLNYVSSNEYREAFFEAIKKEITRKGSFKKYKRNTFYSFKTKMCYLGKGVLGTVGVGFVGVSFISGMALGFMPVVDSIGWYFLGGLLGGGALAGASFGTISHYSCYGKK